MAEPDILETGRYEKRNNEVFLNSFRDKYHAGDHPYKDKLAVIACLKDPGHYAGRWFHEFFFIQTRE
ncbi:MAG TPA: hypothetical protein DDW27_05080 [Bacteroidales bacterium]|nr:hypothetical protein [Bacteroidales bacterium]